MSSSSHGSYDKNSGKIKWNSKILKKLLKKNNYQYILGDSNKDTAGVNDIDTISHLRDENNISYNGDVQQSYAEYMEKNGFGLNDGYAHNFHKFKTNMEAAFEPAQKGKTFIFFTKPNLNLMSNIELDDQLYQSYVNSNTIGSKIKNFLSISGDDTRSNGEKNNREKIKTYLNSRYNGFFQWMCTQYPHIVDSLRYSVNRSSNSIKSNFIPILTNMFKNTSIEDHAVYESIIGDTYKGYQQRLYGTYAQSFAGGSISFTYAEDNLLSVTLLHKLWVEYCEAIKVGSLAPTLETLTDHELDYTSTLYYFVTEADGETLSFWGRYIGIIPQGVPYSAFNSNIGDTGPVELNCTYMYSFKEFMEPNILYDFNLIGNDGSDLKLDSPDEISENNIFNLKGVRDINAELLPNEFSDYNTDSNFGSKVDDNIFSIKYSENNPEPLTFSHVAVVKAKATDNKDKKTSRFKLKFINSTYTKENDYIKLNNNTTIDPNSILMGGAKDYGF